MELVALYKLVIGLDIHQAKITAYALIEEVDGSTRIKQRQFGGFKRDRLEVADWAASLRPDEVVMESTGIYWKSPHAELEAVGIRAKVVNARHVKNVLGCKTDVGNAHWLAMQARAELLRGSLVPSVKLWVLRLTASQLVSPNPGPSALTARAGSRRRAAPGGKISVRVRQGSAKAWKRKSIRTFRPWKNR